MSEILKKTIAIIGLVFLASTLVASDFAPAKAYKITGEFITFGLDNPRRAKDKDVSDYDSASVVVTYERLNDDGETETIELATGNFENGEVHFKGEIAHPTEVSITVQANESDALTERAMIVPGGNEVTFAYVVHFGVVADTTNLHLLGSSRQSNDPTKRVSIVGDLSALNDKLSFAAIEIHWKEYVDGEKKTRVLGSVMAENGTFLLEFDLKEAVVAEVFVSAVPEEYFLSWVDVVIEPSAEIKVHANESGEDLIATAERGRHEQLIDRWRQSAEYLGTSAARDAAFDEYTLERRAQILTEVSVSKNPDSGTSSTMVEDTDSDSEAATTTEAETNDDKTASTTQAKAKALGPQAAAGCEHIVMDDVQSRNSQPNSDTDEPLHIQLKRELDEIRSISLQDIATTAKDPMNSLLAMELGAFSSASKNRTEALPIYDKLTSLLDEDLVARRVSPKFASFLRAVEKKHNDENLVQGQKVPSFALATLEGDEVALDDVLKESDFVLIDFWASWCGPCIADFPSLKKLHSNFNDDGFEIIAISIDSTFEAWEDGSEEHQLPWISLGEIEGWNGPTTKAYGVSFIPKKYLIDSQGCILKKDLSTSALEEFLATRIETAEN